MPTINAINAPQPQTGKFLTLEGSEGAGKSTNLLFMQTWLANKGIELVITREPGGTVISETIRGILLNTEFSEMTPNTELLLMFAARNQHIEEKIKPALNAGKWVISDRFTDSSYAYQGVGRGIENARLESLENWVQQGFNPDKTFVFDLPVDVGMARVKARGEETDRFEQEDLDFFEKVRQAYLDRAQQTPARYAVLDASKSLTQVQGAIVKELTKLLA